ncbi:MAG TPA: hypothetical protein VHS03_14145 [Gaiellaceae bacterium]|nr:hypothetical protein [Gaiellaceae bacterium]
MSRPRNAPAQPRADLHVVETKENGTLVTTESVVDEIVEKLKHEKKIVLHFHGGLVDADAGRRIAAGLQKTYEAGGAYPVFFVWHAGLLEVLKGNLGEIVEEAVFQALEKWVTKFAAGKLQQDPGQKGLTLRTPSDFDVLTQLQRRNAGEEPYDDLAIPAGLDELTQAEQTEFEQAVAADPDVRNATADIVAEILPRDETVESRGVVVARRGSRKTLMDTEVLEDFRQQAEAADDGQKGIISGALLARKATEVLIHVVQRYRNGNDHGVYPTIVEEILRAFYLGNAGALIWAAMKAETADTFQDAEPARGGRYFMSRLGEAIRAGERPEVTLVGHSTGAVFIDNLLRHVEAMRDDPAEPLPADFRFKNLVFLAPACTFEDFESAVRDHASLFDRFRMFAMTDKAESEDRLVPLVYTRSLLYFVSGVLETEPDGSSSPAKPLVGLNRYYGAARPGEPAAIGTVRKFVDGDPSRVVWSPAQAGDGLSSGAVHHGAFDDDKLVRASLTYLIAHS